MNEVKLLKKVQQLINRSCRQESIYTNAVQGQTVENTDQISDTQSGLMETYEMSDTNAQDIADNRTAIMEIYELLEGGNE